MLGVDAHALRAAWTVFLFALLAVVVYLIRDTLMLFAVAVFFAYMLAPIVRLVEHFVPKNRNIALAIVYVVLVGGLVAAGIGIASMIAAEATSLASHLPALLRGDKLAGIPLPAWLEPLREKITEAIHAETITLEQGIVPLLQSLGGRVLAGLGSLLPVILVPILGFFLLKDSRDIRNLLIGSLSAGGERNTLMQILADIHDLLSRYIRALVLLALAAFAAWFLFLEAISAPYPLLLAGIAGVLELIPVIGPLTAVVVALIVCGVSGFGGLLWIVLFAVAFRLFQDYVLNPYLMSAGIEVHPLLVLFGVLAGERLGGIPGMFFSVPLIAVLKIVYFRLRELRDLKDLAVES